MFGKSQYKSRWLKTNIQPSRAVSQNYTTSFSSQFTEELVRVTRDSEYPRLFYLLKPYIYMDTKIYVLHKDTFRFGTKLISIHREYTA